MIFQGFRHFVDAIKALTSALEDLALIQRELGPALDRLEILERTRHQFEAECEGMLLKADGKLKAAANAEARERQIKKRADERLADVLDPDVTEGADDEQYLRPGHAPESGAQGVPPVRLALATNDKTAAVRAKFGL